MVARSPHPIKTSDPSQVGSDGGTNPSSDSADTPSSPASPDPGIRTFQADVGQDDFDPGLLDPLAWTISEDQPFAGLTDWFDADDLLLPAPGAGAAGPSTLMDRPDDVAIGGASDSHSALGWGADSFASPPSGPIEAQAVRDPFAVDPSNDSIAAGTTAWRRLSNSLDRQEETGSTNVDTSPY